MSTIFFAPSGLKPWALQLDRREHPGLLLLEISSRSQASLGRRLSAMALSFLGADGERRRVEVAYQNAKDYGDGPAAATDPMNGFHRQTGGQDQTRRPRADRLHPRRPVLAGRGRDRLLRLALDAGGGPAQAASTQRAA